MSCQDKRWIWLEPSRLHLIARVCQGAEPDWKHLQIQCRMIFHSVSVEAFVLPAFFVFSKIKKKLSF